MRPPTGFNPRAHAGRDGLYVHILPAGGVSIHAPTRGATVDRGIVGIAVGFQSTRPRGARRSLSVLMDTLYKFQSTRPRGARHLRRCIWMPEERFQSTRPRGARLGWLLPLYTASSVSIHAPTRGATTFFPSPFVPVCVSIHAPTRGATLILDLVTGTVGFQSTRPRGARLTPDS